MKRVAPSVEFAKRTAKGERRRIRSFLKEIESLGVEVEDLPPKSVRALGEADKFLARYLAALCHEVPSPEQLDGVIEGLGGIDRVVRHAMADILRSLGWKPDPADAAAPRERGPGRPRGGTRRKPASTRGKVIPFPGPGYRRRNRT
jgi:hypothetical protein